MTSHVRSDVAHVASTLPAPAAVDAFVGRQAGAAAPVILVDAYDAGAIVAVVSPGPVPR